jgi:hypothetical protein
MRKMVGLLGAFAVAAVTSQLMLAMPATASIDDKTSIQTDPTTGQIAVTLASGKVETISPGLAAQIASAMQAGDAAAVKLAMKNLILAVAPNNPNLATAILLVAKASTSDRLLQLAARDGVLEAIPGARTIIAENFSSSASGVPAGGGGGSGGNAGGGVPSGGTSGGGTGTVPSGN